MFTKYLALYQYQNLHFHVKERKLISLEFKDLVERMIIKKEGGICYHHCQLTYYVLCELGFDTRLVLLTNLKNDDIRFDTNIFADHSM